MRYTVTKSIVDVIGKIWMPYTTCAMRYDLTNYQLESLAREKIEGYAETWREAVDLWLGTNAGDFQSIEDFSASLEINGETINIPWSDEESELTYNVCMYGDDAAI